MDSPFEVLIHVLPSLPPSLCLSCLCLSCLSVPLLSVCASPSVSALPSTRPIPPDAQMGNRWTAIAAKVGGRTDNAVKNYWNSRLKKRIDSMQHAVNQHFERKKRQKIQSMLAFS